MNIKIRSYNVRETVAFSIHPNPKVASFTENHYFLTQQGNTTDTDDEQHLHVLLCRLYQT